MNSTRKSILICHTRPVSLLYVSEKRVGLAPLESGPATHHNELLPSRRPSPWMGRGGTLTGFTLIELLVVIAILAILAVVVVLTLNPAGLLQEARDSNRISDLGLLKNTIALYLADVPNSNIASSSLGYGACYVSTISGNGTTTANCGVFLSTYSANMSTTVALYRKTDSTGWIPINISQISFGTPLSLLPVDPVNNGRYYYSYAATTSGSTFFQLDAFMESKKYGFNGASDIVSTDGGSNTSTYETGSKPGLNL